MQTGAIRGAGARQVVDHWGCAGCDEMGTDAQKFEAPRYSVSGVRTRMPQTPEPFNAALLPTHRNSPKRGALRREFG
jgi:hypothetical protein